MKVSLNLVKAESKHKIFSDIYLFILITSGLKALGLLGVQAKMFSFFLKKEYNSNSLCSYLKVIAEQSSLGWFNSLASLSGTKTFVMKVT